MKKIVVHHRSSHHAVNSGYGKLVEYLDGVDVVSGKSSLLPDSVARFIKNKQDIKQGIYDSNSAKKNEELIRKLWFSNSKDTVVHYLNGERDIRQAIHYFKNVISVATFHKPTSVLQTTISDTRYLRKLNGAVAVGMSQVEFLKDWLGLDNVAYIPHGIDTNFFVPDVYKRKENTILFVGQHLRDFEALNSVVSAVSEIIPAVRFQVVLKKEFVDKVQSHRNIQIFSKVNDEALKTMYQEATALFLPLKDVTACNSLLEAMACGTPIITTDLPSNRGYGLTDFNSVLISPNAYIDAVCSMLQSSESSLRHLSKNIRENALDYNWSEIARKLELFYKSMER